jgi:ATP-dependent helicase/nuclease subunit A
MASEIRAWKDNGKYRLRDIALLFRALVDVPIYARALREAGIRFVVDGGKAFVDRPEVVEAFALLRAIANSADPVATLAVLRTSLGGVPDSILADYARAGGAFRWTAGGRTREILSDFPPVERAFRRLEEFDHERRRLPLDRWIQKTLTESEFTLLMASYFEGAQRLANVRKLAERAASLTRERAFTLEQNICGLEEEFSGSRAEGESPLADEGLDAVRVLTIHKAKGLEYPVVLLPDISRGRPGPEHPTKVELMRTQGQPFLAVWISKRLKVINTAASIVEKDERQHEEAENKRLLYVATTRAKERLILINNSPKQKTAWINRLEAAWGYKRTPKDANPYPDDGALLGGGNVRHRVLRGEVVLAPTKPGAATPADHYRAFQHALETVSQERPPRFRSPSNDHRAEELSAIGEDGASPGRDRDLARASGVTVHRLLEQWDMQRAKTLRVNVDDAVKTAAREFGIDPDALAKDVGIILQGFLASDLPAYLAGSEILGREVPVLFRDKAGTTVHGYADLVYRRDGKVHVADYKTDETTARERAEVYRGQLTDYGEALRRGMNLSEPPTTEVLFVRTGERLVFDSEPTSKP